MHHTRRADRPWTRNGAAPTQPIIGLIGDLTKRCSLNATLAEQRQRRVTDPRAPGQIRIPRVAQSLIAIHICCRPYTRIVCGATTSRTARVRRQGGAFRGPRGRHRPLRICCRLSRAVELLCKTDCKVVYVARRVPIAGAGGACASGRLPDRGRERVSARGLVLLDVRSDPDIPRVTCGLVRAGVLDTRG